MNLKRLILILLLSLAVFTFCVSVPAQVNAHAVRVRFYYGYLTAPLYGYYWWSWCTTHYCTSSSIINEDVVREADQSMAYNIASLGEAKKAAWLEEKSRPAPLVYAPIPPEEDLLAPEIKTKGE